MKSLKTATAFVCTILCVLYFGRDSFAHFDWNPFHSCAGECAECTCGCFTGDAEEGEDDPPADSLSAYASHEFIHPGGDISLAVSGFADTCTIFVIRILPDVDTIKVFPGIPVFEQQTQSQPYRNGAGWNWTLGWQSDAGIPCGLYVFHIRGRHVTDAPFVVVPEPDMLPQNGVAFIMATNTYNAYNEFMGQSMYSTPIRYYISKNRPWQSERFRWWKYTGPVDEWPREQRHTFLADLMLMKWFLSNDYPMLILTDEYMHRYPDAIESSKAVVLGPHSEYWSEAMVNGLWRYLRTGGNLLILGGNSVYWKVCYNDSSRVLECMKNGARQQFDGTQGGQWLYVAPQTVIRDITTTYYTSSGLSTYSPYEILVPKHWAFRGTGSREGSLIGTQAHTGRMASGWETDKTNIYTPYNALVIARGLNPFDRLGVSRFYPHDGVETDPNIVWNGAGGAEMTYWDTRHGGFVFNAGSISFTYSLVVDQKLGRIIRNITNMALYGTTSDQVETDDPAFPDHDDIDPGGPGDPAPITPDMYTDIDISPNPVSSMARIISPQGFSTRIYDISGREVWKSCSENDTWAPGSNIPTGIYLAVSTKGGQRVTRRIQYIRS